MRGKFTSYDEETDTIFICGDIFPDHDSNNHYDLISVRAVLAHEYWGHRYLVLNEPKFVGAKGSPADESLASTTAARLSPSLRPRDKEQLTRDAAFRLKKIADINFLSKLRFYDRVDQVVMNR